MHGRVTSTEWLTPSLVRVVLAGGELDAFEMPAETDAYVNVAIPPAGAPYDEVFAPQRFGSITPRSVGRSGAATQCAPGTEATQLDARLRGPRRLRHRRPLGGAAEPGDVLVFRGRAAATARPRRRLAPAGRRRVRAARHRRLARGAAARRAGRRPARLRRPRHTSSRSRRPATSTSRGCTAPASADDADLLADAVAELSFPPAASTPSCTARPTRSGPIRRHLLRPRPDPSDMSCSPYWRRNMTDEAWRQ